MVASCTFAPAFELPSRRAADRVADIPSVTTSAASVGLPAQAKPSFDRLRVAGAGTLLGRHLAEMEGIDDAPLVEGNEVRLLIDGPATFAAMFAAIERARRSVLLETYIFEADELGQKMAALLAKKRAEGVDVQVLYDSIGSIGTPPDFFAGLRDARIAVCEFNPVNPIKGRAVDLNHRDHRKILIVDGVVAFTGGVNVSSVYSRGSASRGRTPPASDDKTKSGWRDTQIEVRGPAVVEFHRLFADTWNKQQCEPAEVPTLITPARQGDKFVRVIGSTPDAPTNYIYLELLSALRHAERNIYITMAYFVPDAQTIDALTSAATRGVDVRLVLPGFSDSATVFHAGRSHYDLLLSAGVRIYERQDALLHAKTAVIDGVWSMVGSANIDWRSFIHNDEVSAIVLGDGFARQMTVVYEQDLTRSTQIDATAWKDRGVAARAREIWGRLWEYWL
ncbi:MAG: phospholipase D-like domain-containing protein, partial [Burkholderiales bacterium]